MHPQPSRRQRGALLIELRVQKWWEVLVMLQSSLPTNYFLTPVLQTSSRNTSQIGSGGGSRAHRGRAYEARLNLILPAVKWWRPTGNAPVFSLLARQVHHFSATAPKNWKLASRPGAAPGRLSFGDSAARAGARLTNDWPKNALASYPEASISFESE